MSELPRTVDVPQQNQCPQSWCRHIRRPDWKFLLIKPLTLCALCGWQNGTFEDAKSQPTEFEREAVEHNL
jgi:hypothetical protein